MELEDVVGARLRAVRYSTLPDLAEEKFVRFGDVHDVSMGVEFATDGGGVFTASWVTEDLDARLEVAAGPISERFPGRDLPALDAAAWEWQELLGRALVEVTSLSGLRPLDEGLTQVGVRLGFDNGRTVTVALGEVDSDGEPTYSVDNLVVLFDPTAAQRYATSLTEED